MFKAKILFWLIGATDGHAKNLSVFLGPDGSYRLALLYDVLTTHQIHRKQMRLAMALGSNNHYRVDETHGRHFVQIGVVAGLP